MKTPKIFLALIVTSLVAAASILAADSKPPAAGFRNVTVEEFDRLRANKNSVVLDVRTQKEFDAGHIPGAVNIDWNGPDFAKKAAQLDKSKIYLVHCAAGGRSAKACNVMTGQLQLTNCVNLVNGFKGWEKAGKPVEH